MADLTFVTTDTAPSVYGTLTDTAGSPIDLSDPLTTVRFQMRLTADSRFAVDDAAVIVNGATGSVRYDFVSGGVPSIGNYVARWQITFPDGTVQHSDPPNTIAVAAE